MRKTRWLLLSVTGLLSLALVAGVWLVGGTSVASAAEMTAEDLQAITQSTSVPGLLGDGYLTHSGWGRGGPVGIDYQQLLADALGTTVEELEAAHEAARTAAIEQAVKEGLITQEQADEMLVWGESGHRGFGFHGFGRGRRGIPGTPDGGIDEHALLAEALGITVDKLQAAREEANQAAIEQAVEEGILTEEQADQMLARKNLQRYLDRDALLASALGSTVEELQAAYDEGKTLSDLMAEKGLEAATVRENLQAAYAEALAQAVEDGVITQEQADEMSNGRGVGYRGLGPGMMAPGHRGGPGGFHGCGGPEGQRPFPPDAEDDTSGAILRRPGRSVRADSTL